LASAVAASVCLVASSLALVVTAYGTGGRQGAVGGILLGLFCRTGLPLIVGLLVIHGSQALARANVFGMILIYYLVTLVAETVLSVRLIGAAGKRVKAV
jgi:hypothetical protein